ncbi:MAG: hypothetical protein R3E54_14325 [Halioglobus sp.]
MSIALRHQSLVNVCALLVLSFVAGCSTVRPVYFGLQFIDDETGRGVPLVEISSTNAVTYISDSAGWVAVNPRDFETEMIYFSVRSPGYSPREHIDGFPGIRVSLRAGGRRIVPLQRTSVAQRLYRVTGEGIYHDSQLLGKDTPFPARDAPPGGVFGQDSVENAIYDDRLYWFWGDTRRGGSPLGNFAVSGAVSALPSDGGMSPDDGVKLEYFVDANGFVRAMCPLEGGGLVWISGLTVFEENGREIMFAHYARLRDLGDVIEHGIALWNDEQEVFEKAQEFPLNVPLHPRGRPLKQLEDGQQWLYFGQAFPNIRVRASWKDILEPQRYQAFTPLKAGSRWRDEHPPLERDSDGQLAWAWKDDTDLITEERWQRLLKQDLVKPEEERWPLRDMESGDRIVAHSGSVSWNAHRNRWVLVFGEVYGESFLGEVWYAEGPGPMGPWSAARKIVTHDRYSFYNVKQHPFFASGPYIYFEGTYSKLFSGSETPTPRYDYNQIMYRLNLDDPRLPRFPETGVKHEGGAGARIHYE